MEAPRAVVSWLAQPIKTCRLCGGSYELGLGPWRAHMATVEHVDALHARAAARRDPDDHTGDRRRAPTAAELRVILDEHEEGVLYQVCMRGRYASVVQLAADYYETNEEVMAGRVLEWNLVELLLDDLNRAGLVTYALAPTPLGEVIVKIRPTRAAYARIGKRFKIDFPWVRMANAGYADHGPALRGAADPTDFRSHHMTPAFAGPVTREDFIDHCAGCDLDHFVLHRAQLVELYGTDELFVKSSGEA